MTSLINKPPNGGPVDVNGGTQMPGWPSFWSAIFNILSGGTKSGTTAQRPNAEAFRWIGMPYYDTDLGFQINLDSIKPDVWHDGQGNIV